MQDIIVKKYGCLACDKLYAYRGDAKECCPPQPLSVWECLVCKGRFYDVRSAKEHSHALDVMTPTEQYLDDLRFGKPPLGEWVATMRAEVEFLIP